MRRILAVALVTVLAACGGAEQEVVEEREPWGDYVTRVVDEYYAHNPELAVYQGLHQYDGQASDFSQASIDEYLSWLDRTMAETAAWIQEHFEPVWESVRPVPLVTIDFGDGNVVRRTLHGNIATYVCSSDGRLVDVLPGIYERETYRRELGELLALHADLRHDTGARAAALLRYHQDRARALRSRCTS